MALSAKDSQSLEALVQLIKESKDSILLAALNNDELKEDYLLRFIRGRDYDIPSSFDRIQRFQTIRVIKYPEIFANLIPSKLSNIIEDELSVILKYPDLLGHRIIWIPLEKWDPSKYTADEANLLLTLLIWECFKNENVQKDGIVLIYDLKGLSLSQMLQITPQYVIKWSNISLKSSAMKIKGLHFVNMHRIFEITLKFVKTVLPKKMKDRIHVYGKTKPGIFSDFMDSSKLPQKLGGELPDAETIDKVFMDKLMSPESENYYQEIAQPSINALREVKSN